MPGGRRGTSAGPKPTRRQEHAIVALLSTPTIDAAARKAGVTDRTLRTWLKQPQFAQAYREARGELLRQTIGLLSRMGPLAVDTLCKLCKEARSESAKQSAARSLLEFSFRGSELVDLEERLAALEQQAANAPGR